MDSAGVGASEAGAAGASGGTIGGGEAGAAGEPGSAGEPSVGCTYSAPIAQTLPLGPTLFENRYAYYPRVIRLEHNGSVNGTLIATVVRQNMAGHWVGHLGQSVDSGLTFSSLGDIDDPMASGGMCCQTLYELPVAIDRMPAGTLLWAATFGADVKPNAFTSVRVWQSPDAGKTWSFLSTVTTSPTANLGTWEPEFTVSADGHLVIFYSDETDPAHSQKLVAWRSTDGITWTDYQAIVASSTVAVRPGMANVRKTANNSWLMSYEICSSDASHVCEVRVRSSADGWSWGDPTNLGEAVALADGEFPASTPTLAVVGNSVLLKGMRQRNKDQSLATDDGKAIFVNTNNGHGSWFSVPAPVPMTDAGKATQLPGYSNPLLGSTDGKAVFQIATDYGTDSTLHAYYAWGPLVPTGSASSEGSAALLVSGSSRFFAPSASGSLEQWPGGGSGTAVGNASKLVGVAAALLVKTTAHVFARTSAGELIHSVVDTSTNTGTNDTWATGLAADPAVLEVGDSQHAWAIDATGALQHWWANPTQGIQHDTWAQALIGRPSAVLDNDAQHLFARMPSGGLLHVWWQPTRGFQQETVVTASRNGVCAPLPPLAGDPVAIVLGTVQHVWFIDEAGALQHLWWNPGQAWHYETWGQGVAGRPSYMQVGDAQHLFARSTAGQLQHWWWSAAQGIAHDTWKSTATVAGDPVAVLNGSKQEVFALDTTGALQHWSWTSATGVVNDSWGK